MSTLLCEAVERAFKNKKNKNKNCLLCYNFKLRGGRLHCVYRKYKTMGMSIINVKQLLKDARVKAKDCKEYNGEF